MWDPVTCTCSLPAKTGLCSDDEVCTVSECLGGECVVTGPTVCDDGNPCTVDWCDPDTGCERAADDSLCDDGAACTTDRCGDASCVHEPDHLACDDGISCTQDRCEAGIGCRRTPLSTECDDGNVCTDDVCAAGVGCTSLANSAPCDDGDPCTTNERCYEGLCSATEGADCDDGNRCTDDVCLPGVGCTHQANADPCNDGDFCTTDDHCKSGACQGGAPLDCDDTNPCTQDNCDSVEACSHTLLPDGNPCSDGNVCLLGDACVSGLCVSGETPMHCHDGNPCTTDTCDAQTGCAFLINTDACDDGDPCTVTDSCEDGTCAGTPLVGEIFALPAEWTGSVSSVVGVPSGLLAGGSANHEPDGPSGVFLAHIGLDWAVSWHVHFPSLVSLANIVATDDGTHVLAAYDTSAESDNRTTVVWVNTVGGEAGRHPVGPPGARPHSLSQLDLGVLVSGRASGSGDTGFAGRVDRDNGEVWFSTYLNTTVLHAIVVGDPGTLLAAGESTKYLHVLELDADTGQEVSRRSLLKPWNVPNMGFVLSRLALIGQRILVVAHGQEPWLTMLDETGATVWSRVPPDLAGARPKSATAVGSGRIALAGYTPTPEGGAYFAIVLDEAGNLISKRELGSLHVGAVSGLNGSLILGGSVDARPALVRTDAWAHPDCSASGGCALLSAQDCDDTDPCTADDCEGGACLHPDVPTPSPCLDGYDCGPGTCEP